MLMKLILRWVAAIVTFLVLATGLQLLFTIYISWLFPINTLKDWVLFALLTPVSFGLLYNFIPAPLYVARMLLLTVNEADIARVFLCITILTLVYAIVAAPPQPYTIQQYSNMGQNIIMIGWLAFSSINHKAV